MTCIASDQLMKQDESEDKIFDYEAITEYIEPTKTDRTRFVDCSRQQQYAEYRTKTLSVHFQPAVACARMTVIPKISFNDGDLVVHGKTILRGVPDNIVMTPGSGVGLVAGAFLGATASDSKSHHVFPVGVLEGLRFMCCFRFKLWWMTQRMGNCGKDIPLETQFMLVESKDSTEGEPDASTIYTVFLPLLEGQFRAVLQGNEQNEMEICLESGDNAVETNQGLYLVYMHAGTNPFEVITQAVKAVEKHMQTFHHREKKNLPSFLDWFGWCTWDAFYTDVTAEGVDEGLKSLSEGGTPPRFLIIDDGWQQIGGVDKETNCVVQEGAQFANRLTGLKENAKFQKNGKKDDQVPGLKHVVDEAKDHHNVKYALPMLALPPPPHSRLLRLRHLPPQLIVPPNRTTAVDAIEKAIFLGNDISELSLADALMLVEYLQDKLNITVAVFGPAVIVAPGTTVEVPAIVGEKTEFNVVFERWGWTVLAPLGVWRGLAGGEALDDSVMMWGWNDSVMEVGEHLLMFHTFDMTNCFLSIRYRYVYVWHALAGYWGGVHPAGTGMENYDPAMAYPVQSPGVKGNQPDIVMDSLAVHGLGLVHPKKVFEFYNELHAYLASCGIDGVKVDVQNIIETLGAGLGGRVSLTRSYIQALEASISRNFRDNGCIACMCHNTDGLYSAKQTAVVRTSDDFYPRDPASHTIHISSVAYNTLFLGEFMQPDWDMFHSLHPAADYHAAARAVGGCPIYVSDKPGNHNFELLKKLVLPDGSVLRAQLPGRPTHDCLFVDPARDGTSLLKVWNANKCTGVVGVFNCQGAGWCKVTKKTRIHDTSPGTLTCSVQATDVDAIAQVAGPDWNGETVVYAYRSGEVVRLPQGASLPVTLKAIEYELFHFCPLKEIAANISFAPIGLLDMFNSGGAVEQTEVHFASDKKPELFDGEVISEVSTSLSENRTPTATIALKVRGCGRFGAYSSQRPLKCTMGNVESEFNYEAATGLLTLTIPVPQEEMFRWPIEILV
ncbi:hypothetical protein RJ640_010771 [Escallonia rubra]|uniref:galactinol--sucrose galactosyltransferase n=1 Tax=Escallonia rubra TaxID=112253 RepID=A0AA88QTD3_9ASTE|nr:hypothetical protein RJ640_010771 [Escallonia rubra]